MKATEQGNLQSKELKKKINVMTMHELREVMSVEQYVTASLYIARKTVREMIEGNEDDYEEVMYYSEAIMAYERELDNMLETLTDDLESLYYAKSIPAEVVLAIREKSTEWLFDALDEDYKNRLIVCLLDDFLRWKDEIFDEEYFDNYDDEEYDDEDE